MAINFSHRKLAREKVLDLKPKFSYLPTNKKILTFILNNEEVVKKEDTRMMNKLANLIFAFTVLAVAHHLYAGRGNPWDPRHDDNKNVISDENSAQAEQPEEIE